MDSKRCTLFRCDRCGVTKSHPPDSCSTGYGWTQDGKIHCFACCALDDREAMDAMKPGDPPFFLYLGDGKVSNWPGTLSYPVLDERNITVRSQKHWNCRYEAVKVRFRDRQGRVWVGINCEATHGQIVKCVPVAGH